MTENLLSSFYIGVEPASDPAEGTTISVTEYSLEPILSYKVRYLERFEPGTQYAEIIQTLTQIREELRGGLVVLNNTFVGEPVKDEFKFGGVMPISINMASETTAIIPHVENAVDPLRKYDMMSWNVPVRDIVSVLQVAFQKGQLNISPELDLAQYLIDEILNFRVEVSSTGRIEKLRVDANADLLLSVAISVYVAARFGGQAIPIENMLESATGIPDILQEETPMPEIWDGQAMMNTPTRDRIKYRWAQPGKDPNSYRGGSNLPGLS